jgi:hypothetical protein
MSILSETYNICKSIKSLPIRKEVAALINVLNTTSSPNSPGDRSTFGYVASKRGVEFLGYLNTHIHSDEIKKLFPQGRFNPLADEEVKLLEKAHSLVMGIHDACLNDLIKIFPNCIMALDTYHDYPYEYGKLQDETSLEMDEPIRRLVDAFEQHPSYLLIKRNINKCPNALNIPKNDLLITMLACSRDLLVKDYKLISDESSQVIEAARKKNGQADFLQILFSLFCLRLSLRTLNRFIYLSFFQDKLAVLDNNNVFHIKTHHTNFLGDFLELDNQPSDSELFSNPGDPILVKLDTGNFVINSPYRIDGMTLSFGEYGEVQGFELRKIDDHLNIISSFYYL